MARHHQPWRGALRVAGVYLILALAWIVFSDHAVQAMFPDPAVQARAQTVKGSVFVLASAAAVFMLVIRELRELHRVEERYRTLVDQSLAGIYVIRDGRFLFANPRLAEIFGRDVGDLLDGTPVSDLVDPEDRERVLDNLRRREGGETREIRDRFTGLRGDGAPVRVEVHGRRVRWDPAPAVLGLLLDVTERERLEERLQRTQRLEALGRLTGAVVHDFNNLLTAIIAPIDLCADQMEPEHPGRPELDEARESARRAVALTRKLLAFSRRRAYRSQPLDLGEVVRGAQPVLTRLCGNRVRIAFDTADSLPAIQADPDALEQVLVNLVVNAREAMEGTGSIQVRAFAEPPSPGKDPRVTLEVTDDGRGMDPQTRSLAVEPFFTTKRNGTGLGLATVHGIVTQLEGEMQIESEVGRGTTFCISLPITDVPAEPVSTPDDRSVDDGSHPAGTVVLVVDDEPAVRRVMVRVLEHHGLATLDAPDASTAIELVRRHGPEIRLVVTDLNLPDMDGAALVARLESMIPDASVIYVSGQSSDEVLGRISREANRRFLEKPFTVAALMNEVSLSLDDERGVVTAP